MLWAGREVGRFRPPHECRILGWVVLCPPPPVAEGPKMRRWLWGPKMAIFFKGNLPGLVRVQHQRPLGGVLAMGTDPPNSTRHPLPPRLAKEAEFAVTFQPLSSWFPRGFPLRVTSGSHPLHRVATPSSLPVRPNPGSGTLGSPHPSASSPPSPQPGPSPPPPLPGPHPHMFLNCIWRRPEGPKPRSGSQSSEQGFF